MDESSIRMLQNLLIDAQGLVENPQRYQIAACTTPEQGYDSVYRIDTRTGELATLVYEYNQLLPGWNYTNPRWEIVIQAGASLAPEVKL